MEGYILGVPHIFAEREVYLGRRGRFWESCILFQLLKRVIYSGRER